MKPADLDRAEILRMLHTPALDASLSAVLDACIAAVCDAAQPRTVWKLLPVTHTAEGVTLGELPLGGRDIAAHLTGCDEAVLLAATLSAPVDALIRKAEHSDLTRAVFCDAAAAAAIEFVCEALERELHAALPYPFFTARFSAGYGDFPLMQQSALIAMLDAPRKIGLTVTPQQTLLPMKSVTAVIGLSHTPTRDARRYSCGNSCALCPHRETCGIRRTNEA